LGLDPIYVDIGLFAIFIAVLAGPFVWKRIEENLEAFLFIMGVLAATLAWKWTYELVRSAIEEPLVRGIVPAVLVAGLVFHYGKERIQRGMLGLVKKVPLKAMVFIIVVALGLVSSVITAMIAALLLVELVYVLPLDRKRRVEIVIISCFSIGLGAVLTPMGEPLSTIAIAALKGDPYYAGFFFLAVHLGVYVLPGVVLFGLIAAVLVGDERPRYLERALLIKSHEQEEHERLQRDKAGFDQKVNRPPRMVVVRTEAAAEKAVADGIAHEAKLRRLAVHSVLVPDSFQDHVVVETSDPAGLKALIKDMPKVKGIVEGASRWPEIKRFLASEKDQDGAGEPEPEKLRDVFVRGLKVYVFVMALIFLGGGMSVLIERYFARIPGEGLYWVNMVSAVLDNATLTAAEISYKLNIDQIRSALMGLLIAGGMLIPGNIPNIIAAHKLKIKSTEWARLGIPLGLGVMLAYFVWLYFVPFP